MHILNARLRDDPRPVDEGCACHMCRNYSRACLGHLSMAKQALGVRLAAVHNFHFLESLMQQVRTAIKEGRVLELTRDWLGDECPCP